MYSESYLDEAIVEDACDNADAGVAVAPLGHAGKYILTKHSSISSPSTEWQMQLDLRTQVTCHPPTWFTEEELPYLPLLMMQSEDEAQISSENVYSLRV